MKYLELPEPDTTGEMPLESCIQKRRSIRHYIDEPLPIKEISQLAWSAQGITDSNTGHRAAPSGGATFPAELYFVTREGVFHYLPKPHALEMTLEGDVRPELCKACLGQGFIKQAALNVIIGMIYPRTSGRYGVRGERYVVLEAGHIAQNLHLQAIPLGLDSVAVGAYKDNAVALATGLPKDVEPVYIVTIGKAK